MRTGKLTISRGHQMLQERVAAPGARPEAPVRPVSFTPCGDTSELHLIQVRLTALERLTRLVEQGAISLDEFKLEKSLVLRLTGEELLLTRAVPPLPPPAAPSPPLVARVPRWAILLGAPLVGVAAFLWAAPAEALAWFDLLAGR
jgi:hypothetical protein